MSYKILVSACLLGQNVRYDAVVKAPVQKLLELYEKGYILTCCPEVDGGLSIPRLPAEIIQGDGKDVIDESSDILRSDGISVRNAYMSGARNALNLAKKHDIKIAVLKSKSPSCSNSKIYDGTFSRTLKDGIGVTAALLQSEGICVFNEFEIEDAIARLKPL